MHDPLKTNIFSFIFSNKNIIDVVYALDGWIREYKSRSGRSGVSYKKIREVLILFYFLLQIELKKSTLLLSDIAA